MKCPSTKPLFESEQTAEPLQHTAGNPPEIQIWSIDGRGFFGHAAAVTAGLPIGLQFRFTLPILPMRNRLLRRSSEGPSP